AGQCALAEIVGYRLEELEPICQKTFLRLVHPDDIAGQCALAEIVGYRLEELEPICQKTFLRLVHPD
ncbi:hypothetical protein C7E12_23555, partial [Stenotrophomonas maltophilia]